MNAEESATRSKRLEARRILHERAVALAQPLADAGQHAESLVVVEFRLANERYAIEQHHVLEVCRLHDLTPLPGAPHFMIGMINLRGQVLCVVDVKKFFELPDGGISDLHSVIIVQSGQTELGIVADSVLGLRSLPLGTLQASLPTLTGIRAEFLKGVTDERVAILDAVKILSDPRLVVDSGGESDVEVDH